VRKKAGVDVTEQICLFDMQTELKPGDYVKTHGPVIPAEQYSDYLGKLVVTDVSTESFYWFRVEKLERIYAKDEALKLFTCILSDGRPHHNSYITNYPWGGPGYEIYELRPCDERNEGYIPRNGEAYGN